MKTLLISTLIVSAAVHAGAEIKMSAACEQQVADVVFDRLGRYDETFSVTGYKVIYQSRFSNLAVVRTSDEVEPREVLVSFVESKDKCTAKYKETLADGLISNIDEEIIDISHTPKTIPGKIFELNGTIVSVTTGEIDPFVIGDVCLIEVKDQNDQITGLITDQWSCDDAAESIKAGKSVTLQIHKQDRIRKKSELEVLRRMFPASRFYKIPFDQIKAN